MLLRSSSTPVLGSLLSSFSDSPNSSSHHHRHPESHSSTLQNHNKLSFHPIGSLNFTTFSCNSSPISPSVAEFSDSGRNSHNGFRRIQSEGNLKGLANASCSIDEFSFQNPPRRFSRRPNCSLLQTIPSFSFHGSRSRYEDEESDAEVEEEEEEREAFEENGELSNKAINSQESLEAEKFGEFSLEAEKNMNSNGEMRCANEFGNLGFVQKRSYSPEKNLGRGLVGSTGLGIDSGDEVGPYAAASGGANGGSGGDIRTVAFGGQGGDGGVLDEHYKKMVEENPGNTLVLRNYAQYLYQSKHDLGKAEDYYCRAILADPTDGEILSQYAKLVWQLHRDKDRATSYFERAVQAAPGDCHVQAAYASFLWKIEDEDGTSDECDTMQPLLHTGAMASATA